VRPAPTLALASLVTAALAWSCRAPTEIEIQARTNVAWSENLVASFTVGKPGDTESAFPTTETRDRWGDDGFIGSLVAVPGGAKDATLAVKVVLAIGKEPKDCSKASPGGCIIARRKLRYIPHEHAILPMALYARCIAVPCDEDTTCNALGECVPAEVDETVCASGICDVQGGGSPDATAPIDGSSVDAPSDASRSDAPADAPTDAPSAPGCPTSSIDRCPSGTDCCAFGGPTTYACMSPQQSCLGTRFTCTNRNGCDQNNQSTWCCLPKASTRTQCMPQTICGMAVGGGGKEVCESNDDCLPSRHCTGTDPAFMGMTFCE
jgi:hypothetical protein